MLKRYFPVVGAAALVLMLTTAGTSRAQMGGFWGGWGAMSPFNSGMTMYWPGGIGINYVPGPYTRTGYPGGMGYGGMGMYPGGYMPSSLAISPMSYVAYSPPVFTTRAPVVAPIAGLLPTDQPATIEVYTPDDAIITFDGRRTSQTGAYRVFTTPPLIKGESYHYMIEATFTQGGQKATQRQRVSVYAGGRATAVFPITK